MAGGQSGLYGIYPGKFARVPYRKLEGREKTRMG